MNKRIHIVCHDVPYPVDYGGVFDLFYKIKALHAHGIRIVLHCFDYGRGQQPILANYCESVHYYKRLSGHKGFSTSIPYIVSSRIQEELFQNLLKDEDPILMEGVHCSALLIDDRFTHRKTILRLHNVEYAYYHQLYKHESNLLKKSYYYNESRLLQKYEARIAGLTRVIAVSQKDMEVYAQLGGTDLHYLPVFLPYTDIRSITGSGHYCLYHGNLSVAENEKAAIWLLEQVFFHIKIPLVIAGKNPSSKLTRLAHLHAHTCLVSNPGHTEMQDMIQKAQVNVLPSFNETGVKLKLLNALFNGRHCMINPAAVAGTGLDACCYIATDAKEMQEQLTALFELPFDQEELNMRADILAQQYDTEAQIRKLIEWIP